MTLELDYGKPTCIYRLYDANDVLLYVGVAYDFDARFKQHRYHKGWWPQVARKDIVWYECRVDALHAEARAIATENPVHNDRGSAHPIGLAIIHRKALRPGQRPPWSSFRPMQHRVELARYYKRRIVEEVIRHGSHAVMTFEGEMVGVLVPSDWYEAACEATGQTPTSDRVDPDVLWNPVSYTSES